MIARCNAAGKFLPTVLISKVGNDKDDFCDDLFPSSDRNMNWKSSYISTDSFIKWLGESLLKHEAPAKFILLLDGHRAHCNSPLLFQTDVKRNVNIIRVRSHFNHTLHLSDKCFLDLLSVISETKP